MSIEHQEGWFTGKRDTRLFYQSWTPAGVPRAVLVLLHGLAEHGGRYQNLVNAMIPAGFAIYAADLRGHGRSEGKRCHVRRFGDYIEDLDSFVDLVRDKYPATRIFILGHSMGGTLAAAYAEAHQDRLTGLILSAPALKAGSSITSRDRLLARTISFLFPSAGVASLESAAISRDPAVVTAYVNDPLVYTGRISARLGAELLWAVEVSIPASMSKISLPLLILHGTADRLCDPQGSRTLYGKVSSKDKSLRFYDGFYHEIFNDPERAAVFVDMREWLDRHTR